MTELPEHILDAYTIELYTHVAEERPTRETVEKLKKTLRLLYSDEELLEKIRINFPEISDETLDR